MAEMTRKGLLDSPALILADIRDRHRLRELLCFIIKRPFPDEPL